MTIIYPPTYQEFFDKVSTVDFLYSMSDDPRAHAQGKERVAEVREEAHALGETYVHIYEDWRAYMSSRVTGEDVAEPRLTDYAHE